MATKITPVKIEETAKIIWATERPTDAVVLGSDVWEVYLDRAEQALKTEIVIDATAKDTLYTELKNELSPTAFAKAWEIVKKYRKNFIMAMQEAHEGEGYNEVEESWTWLQEVIEDNSDLYNYVTQEPEDEDEWDEEADYDERALTPKGQEVVDTLESYLLADGNTCFAKIWRS